MNTEIHKRRHLFKMAAIAGSGMIAMGSDVSGAIAADEEKQVEANEDLMG